MKQGNSWATIIGIIILTPYNLYTVIFNNETHIGSIAMNIVLILIYVLNRSDKKEENDFKSTKK